MANRYLFLFVTKSVESCFVHSLSAWDIFVYVMCPWISSPKSQPRTKSVILNRRVLLRLELTEWGRCSVIHAVRHKLSQIILLYYTLIIVSLVNALLMSVWSLHLSFEKNMSSAHNTKIVLDVSSLYQCDEYLVRSEFGSDRFCMKHERIVLAVIGIYGC